MYRQPNSQSIRTVRNTVGELIQFSMYTDRESENPLEADGPTIKFHQTLLGNQGVLDSLVHILLLCLRWHRHNANGSCYARFLPRKLPKTVLLRTAAHDFLPNLRVTHKIPPRSSRGPATALCHLKIDTLFAYVT